MCSFASGVALAENLAHTPETNGDKKTREVVFEVYEHARPSDASRHIRPLLNQLEERGWIALPSSVKEVVGARLPLPGRSDPSMTVARIRERFAEARRKATGKNFNFAKAIELYQSGFRWALENQAVVTTDLDAPQWLSEAYVGYATALAREQRLDEAKRAFRTQAISFRDVPITTDAYGPEAAKQSQAVRKEIDAEPHGTLLVNVDRVDANVSFNFVGRGRGGTFQANVVAATYEVLVQVASTSRRYVVPIDPSTTEHAELRISWDLDSAMVAGDEWIGIERSSPDVAPNLVRKVPGHPVLTLSIVDRADTRWLVATRYAAGDGDKVARCVAALGSEGERSLKTCIAEGRYLDGVYREIPSRAEPRSVTTSAPSQARAWIALGGALGGAAVGAYFVSVHGQCRQYDDSAPRNCLDARDGRLGAAISIGVGATSLAYMTYAYMRYSNTLRRRSQPLVGVSIGTGGGMVTVTGGF